MKMESTSNVIAVFDISLLENLQQLPWIEENLSWVWKQIQVSDTSNENESRDQLSKSNSNYLQRHQVKFYVDVML